MKINKNKEHFSVINSQFFFINYLGLYCILSFSKTHLMSQIYVILFYFLNYKYK